MELWKLDKRPALCCLTDCRDATVCIDEAHDRGGATLKIGGVSTVERAYQLAQSGKFRIVSEVREQLRLEGFGDAIAQFSSRTLKNDLRRVLDAARKEP